jgi:hypothetical protein
MSEEHETARQADNISDEGKQALSALRGIWSAQNQTSANLDEACGNTKSCKNMEAVGFDGLIDDVGMSAKKGSPAVGGNLRAAWKTKLEREGKLNTEVRSVRGLVFGSSDSNSKD